jgi:hypothetical protein
MIANGSNYMPAGLLPLRKFSYDDSDKRSGVWAFHNFPNNGWKRLDIQRYKNEQKKTITHHWRSIVQHIGMLHLEIHLDDELLKRAWVGDALYACRLFTKDGVPNLIFGGEPRSLPNEAWAEWRRSLIPLQNLIDFPFDYEYYLPEIVIEGLIPPEKLLVSKYQPMVLKYLGLKPLSLSPNEDFDTFKNRAVSLFQLVPPLVEWYKEFIVPYENRFLSKGQEGEILNYYEHSLSRTKSLNQTERFYSLMQIWP